MYNPVVNTLVRDLCSVVALTYYTSSSSSSSPAAGGRPPPDQTTTCLHGPPPTKQHRATNDFDDEETLKRARTTAFNTLKLIMGHTFQLKNWARVFNIMKSYCAGTRPLGQALGELRVLAAKDFCRFAGKSAQMTIDLYRSSDVQVVEPVRQACFNLFMEYYGAVYARDALSDAVEAAAAAAAVNKDAALELTSSLSFFSSSNVINCPSVNANKFGCAIHDLVKYIQGSLSVLGNYTVTPMTDYAVGRPVDDAKNNNVTAMIQAQRDAAAKSPRARGVSLKLARQVVAFMPRMMNDLERNYLSKLVASGRHQGSSHDDDGEEEEEEWDGGGGGDDKRGVLVKHEAVLRMMAFDQPHLSRGDLLEGMRACTLRVSHRLLRLYFPVDELRRALQTSGIHGSFATGPRQLYIGQVQNLVAGSAAAVAYSWGDMSVAVLYVLKFLRFVMQIFALYVAARVFQQAYVTNVYANRKDPPPVDKLLLLFVGLDLTLQLIVTTFLVLVVAPSGSLKTVINDNFMSQFLMDEIATTFMVLLLGFVLSHFVWRKTYFHYKTDGIGALKSYTDMMVGACAIMVVIPFFLLF
jgi:DNA-binding winged helix-turn-helix (wHTH) protein